MADPSHDADASRHGLLFEQSPVPMFIASADGARLLHVNGAGALLHGRTPNELLSMSIAELMPADPAAVGRALAQMGDAWHPVNLGSFVIRKKDGEAATVEATVARSRFDGEECLIAAAVDVTARVEASRKLNETLDALRTSEARLQVALETSSDGLYDADFRSGLLTVNERAERMLGYEGTQLPREIADWAALVHPDDMDKAAEMLAAHARGELPAIEYEIRMRRADGSWAWILDRGRIVESLPDGSPRRLIGTLTDITDRRAEAIAIAQQKDLFDTVLSNIPILLVFIRPDGSLEYANQAFTALTGWSVGELAVAEIMAEFFPDAQYRAEVAAFMASRSREWRDWRLRTRDGREVLTAWTNVTLADGRLIGIGQDVSEQRAAEAERRQLESQLLQAQKLESLGVLAGGVAHDFNNLLVGIVGNASLSEEVLAPDHPAAPLVHEMRAAATRAAELTRQLLAYAGKGHFVVERVNLSHVADEMAALLKAVISKNATLHTDFAPDLPDVQGDATQLRQVIMNLITNASEALGGAAGRVTLRTGEMQVDDAFLRGAVGETLLAPGRGVFLEVDDTGQGMDAAMLPRIFEPFFTTKFTGRGLGLAATLGIVRSHRGAISVRSTKGRGTTMRLVFPPARAGTASGAFRAARPAAERWTADGDVLLADDEPAVRSVSRRALERVGFRVSEVADGREALDRFRAEPARWRAVVLDLTMPHLTGDAALRAMLAIRADLPAVLYSGYSEEALAADLTGRPGLRFLQKPFTVAALGEALRAVLGEGTDAPSAL
jgi:PAS domain S-box-containing protein